jgi:hypothetical protein
LFLFFLDTVKVVSIRTNPNLWWTISATTGDQKMEQKVEQNMRARMMPVASNPISPFIPHISTQLVPIFAGRFVSGKGCFG